MVILGGDLNMHPQDLGNRLLRSYTGLRDSYSETAKFDVRRTESETQFKYSLVTFGLLIDSNI